jgi:hypothetical protein
MAFPFCAFEDIDERKALDVVNSIAAIMRGEDLPENLFPVKKRGYITAKFADDYYRAFNPVEGFLEI